MISWDELTHRVVRIATAEQAGIDPLALRDDTELDSLDLPEGRRRQALLSAGRGLFKGYTPEVDVSIPPWLLKIKRFGKFASRAGGCMELDLDLLLLQVALGAGGNVASHPAALLPAAGPAAKDQYVSVVIAGYRQRTGTTGDLPPTIKDRLRGAQDYGGIRDVLKEVEVKRLLA